MMWTQQVADTDRQPSHLVSMVVSRAMDKSSQCRARTDRIAVIGQTSSQVSLRRHTDPAQAVRSAPVKVRMIPGETTSAPEGLEVTTGRLGGLGGASEEGVQLRLSGSRLPAYLQTSSPVRGLIESLTIAAQETSVRTPASEAEIHEEGAVTRILQSRDVALSTTGQGGASKVDPTLGVVVVFVEKEEGHGEGLTEIYGAGQLYRVSLSLGVEVEVEVLVMSQEGEEVLVMTQEVVVALVVTQEVVLVLDMTLERVVVLDMNLEEVGVSVMRPGVVGVVLAVISLVTVVLLERRSKFWQRTRTNMQRTAPSQQVQLPTESQLPPLGMPSKQPKLGYLANLI